MSFFFVCLLWVGSLVCDYEDVETMLESFKQQQQMLVLELYIEKDVAGGSMFHSANSLTSCWFTPVDYEFTNGILSLILTN